MAGYEGGEAAAAGGEGGAEHGGGGGEGKGGGSRRVFFLGQKDNLLLAARCFKKGETLPVYTSQRL